MSAIWLVASRELTAYLKSFMGWGVLAGLLFIDGLLFQAYAMGSGEHLSSEVLRSFFYFSSGVTMVAGVLLSMRLLSSEQKDGTLVLLYTAPINEWHIVLGKWLSAFLFLCIAIALTAYQPAMIAVNGSVHPGHVMAGYVGLVLLAASVTAIGTFTSALTKHQLVAGMFAAIVVVVLLLTWWAAKVADAPFDGLLAYMAMYDKHFTPFSKGVIHTRSLVYFATLTMSFLVAARVVLGARRWR